MPQEAQTAAKAGAKAAKATVAVLRERLEALAAALRATVAVTLCCCDALETAARATPSSGNGSGGGSFREPLGEVTAIQTEAVHSTR